MPLRITAGAAALGAVALTVTGGALVGPAKQEAAAEAKQAFVAQQVAQVWRSAGSSGPSGTSQGAGASSAASSEVVALQAELVSERGGSASRSEDRLAAAQPAAPSPSAPSPAADPSSAPPADPADPVAQAEQRVQELVGQQSADSADASQATRASEVPASQALAAVSAAEAQRAAAEAQRLAEEAAAQLAAAQADPRAVAAPMVAAHGWGADQFSCLDKLWTKESGWSWSADNPTSSAYGIPQSLPGSKMASHGADWQTDPRVQIAWGLDYIAASYGTPCRAWSHSQSVNWY